jgi:DNA-binding PucR family transcriptional regulator
MNRIELYNQYNELLEVLIVDDFNNNQELEESIVEYINENTNINENEIDYYKIVN